MELIIDILKITIPGLIVAIAMYQLVKNQTERDYKLRLMELKQKKSGISRRSMGMIITQDRMEIINKLYDTQTAVEVTDLEDDSGNAAGTRVVLTIPV